MGRRRLDSVRLSCGITKSAAQKLDRVFDQIFFAGRRGWQDPKFKGCGTKRQWIKPVGRKPVGLVMSLLITKTTAELWEEIIELVQPRLHTEHADRDAPLHWNIARFGGGFVKPEEDSEAETAQPPIKKPLKGVRPANGRFYAAIRVKGKRVSLGLFKTVEQAAQAYDRAALEHFGRKARLNFSKSPEEIFNRST
jgi:hypothetical protein